MTIKLKSFWYEWQYIAAPTIGLAASAAAVQIFHLGTLA